MRSIPTVIWNVTGQQLALRFPTGRPTSATFAVYRAYGTDDATAEFSGNATLDTPNTTTNGAAGRSQTDPQRIPLTDTSGITTGREYLLSANSLSELVQVIEIGAGYVRVQLPLQNDYAVGAAFVSTLLFASVPDVFAADRGKLSDLSDTHSDYRVKWVVTYAGAASVVYSFFDLVRQPVVHHVTIGDVNARAPGLLDDLPIEYQPEQGRPLIEAGWKMARADLVGAGIDPNSIRDNEAIDELVLRAALVVLAEGGWHPKVFDALSYVKLKTDSYNDFYESHFQVTVKPRLDLQVGTAQTLGELPERSTRFLVK